MKTAQPLFGFLSGLATASCFLPPVLAFVLFILFGEPAKDNTLLFIFMTMTARLSGDWLFWSWMFAKDMDAEKSLANWRSSVKDLLLSHPDAIRSILSMLFDFAADIFLVYVALKVSTPSAWVFLSLFGSQTIAAPFQGLLGDHFDRRKGQLFSKVVTALTTITALEISGWETPGSHLQFLGMADLSASTQMLILLSAKGLFTNSTILARGVIANCIRVEAVKS